MNAKCVRAETHETVLLKTTASPLPPLPRKLRDLSRLACSQTLTCLSFACSLFRATLVLFRYTQTLGLANVIVVFVRKWSITTIPHDNALIIDEFVQQTLQML